MVDLTPIIGKFKIFEPPVDDMQLFVTSRNVGSECECPTLNSESIPDDDKEEVEEDGPVVPIEDRRINKFLLYQLQKRGLDLGTSRGFSAKQAAKHMVGLAAASLPTSPGRRK